MAILRKYFILVFCAILFFSCKTTKYNVKDTYTESKEVKTEVVTEITEKENMVITENRKTDQFENIVETITTIKLEAGEPIEISTILRKIVKGSYEYTETNTEKANETQTNISENTEEKQDIKNIFEDKTVIKSKTPIWITAAVVSLFVVILLVILLVLKRYRLI
jgi:aspartyl-tRNA synthetase